MTRLSLTCLIATLILAPFAARADGYVMGAGRWTCGDLIRINESGTDIEMGQVFGWILGYWSSATFQRETEFIDTVEAAGGAKIAGATIAQCRKAPPETVLYRVADEMIRNTR